MRELEIKNVKVLSIEGKEMELAKEVTDFLCKEIGNAIYNQARDIEIRRIAKSIYDGEKVELTEEQAAHIKSIVLDPKQCNISGLLAFSIGEHIDKEVNEKE